MNVTKLSKLAKRNIGKILFFRSLFSFVCLLIMFNGCAHVHEFTSEGKTYVFEPSYTIGIQIDRVTPTQEIGINGDFEEDQDGFPEGWSTWVRKGHENEVSFFYDTKDKYSGNRSAKIVSTGEGDACYWMRIDLESVYIYDFVGYTKVGNEKDKVSVRIRTIGSDGKTLNFFHACHEDRSTSSWRRFIVSFKISEKATRSVIELAGRGTVWFDHLQLFYRREEIHAHGRTFYRTYQKKLTLETEKEEDYFLLIPDDPDELGKSEIFVPKDRPQKELFAVPGETKTFSFAICANRSFSSVEITSTDFHKSFSKRFSADNIEIVSTAYWNQRTTLRKTDWFYTIPELLIKAGPKGIVEGTFLHYWIRINVPENIAPGRYEGKLLITADEIEKDEIQIVLNVLPFEFVPSDKIWILYPDSDRWIHYSDQELREELEVIHRHGIKSLQLSASNMPDMYSVERDSVVIDFSHIDRLMQHLERVGFESPVVINLLWLEKILKAKTKISLDIRESSRLARLYQSVIKSILDRSRINHWPEIVFNLMDEPGSRSEDQQQKAIYLYRLVRYIGGKVYVNTNETFVDMVSDPLLDIQCYYVDYALTSEAQRDRAIERVQRHNGRFWYYGSGCYTGLEGKIFPNRFLTGFLFWKSGATGHYSWTFQRPMQNPFDDFDGEKVNPKEPKDACIVYPLQKGNGFIPTLQWEGIREGITDVKYASTLEHYIKLAKQSSQPDVISEAHKAEKGLQTLKEQIPWHKEGGFDNVKANKLRREIARQIIRLQQKLD